MCPASLMVKKVKSLVGAAVTLYEVTYPAGMFAHSSLYHGFQLTASDKSPAVTRDVIHSSLPL